MNVDVVLQVLTNGVFRASLYAMMGLGFGLIFGGTETFHLAYAFTILISGYLTWVAVNLLHFPLLLGCLIGVMMAAITGLACEKAIYQPLRRRDALPFNIFLASLGIMIVGESLIHIVFGPSAHRITFTDQRIIIGTVGFTRLDLISAVSAWGVIGGMALLLRFTKYGRAIRAVSSNLDLAKIIGIDHERIYLIIFAAASTLAGIGGVFYALENSATLEMGFPLAVVGIVGVFLGGTKSLSGAVIGSAVLGLAEGIGAIFLPGIMSNLVAFALLFIVLLVRPGGILGKQISLLRGWE